MSIFENIDIDIAIDKANLKNIDIDIDMAIFENIDIYIDMAILKNIDIDIDRKSLRNINIDIDKEIIKISINNGAKWVQNLIIFACFQSIFTIIFKKWCKIQSFCLFSAYFVVFSP